MNRVLTAREINRRYDGEWVLVSDPKMDEAKGLVRGRVLLHDRDSDALYRKAFAMKDLPDHVAVLRIGKPSPVPVLVL